MADELTIAVLEAAVALNGALRKLAEDGIRVDIYISDREYIGMAAPMKKTNIGRFWKELEISR